MALFDNIKEESSFSKASGEDLHYVAIMGTWFSPWIFVLAMIGPFVGGLIFNYLTEKFVSMQASWFVHLMANLAINIVGFIMSGIIR